MGTKSKALSRRRTSLRTQPGHVSRPVPAPPCCSQVKRSESRSVVSNCWGRHGLYTPWNSPGQNTGVGSCFLLQGIFPTQESNPGLPHRGRILYQLSHKGSPRIPEWVACPYSRGNLPTQGSNRGLLDCRRILYQASYEGSPNPRVFSPAVFQLHSLGGEGPGMLHRELTVQRPLGGSRARCRCSAPIPAGLPSSRGGWRNARGSLRGRGL